MAEFMDPYAGSTQQTDDSKRRLLEAVATAGLAGKKAFEEAQSGIQSSQHAALQRAQEGATMFGGGAERFGAGNLATRFDLQRGNLGAAGAEFAAQNASMGAAGSGYMDKVQAALGALKEQNAAKTGEYDAQIQAYKTRLEQEAAAAAAAAAAKEQAEMNRLRIREQGENARATARLRADAEKEAKAATKNITLQQLLGMANSQPGVLTHDTRNILGTAVGGEKQRAANLADSARQIGGLLGVDPTRLAELNAPGFQQNLTKDFAGPAAPKQVPGTFDKNWLLGSFRYEGKPISTKRADEVLRAPEVAMANQFIGTLANTRVTNGRINDDSAGEYKGLTPEEAFNRWLNAQPGIRTMKTALRDYYLPWINQNLK